MVTSDDRAPAFWRDLRLLRGGAIVIDVGIVALTNVAILIVAARSLEPIGLTYFSLLLLFGSSAVAVQRAALITPGLSTQRITGKARIPAIWAVWFSIPGSILVGLLAWIVVYPAGTPPAELAFMVLAVGGLTVGDIFRYRLFGNGRSSLAVLVDAGALGAALVLLFFFPVLASREMIVASYAVLTVGAAISLAALAIPSKGRRSEPLMRVRRVWRLGRWSGADALIGSVVNIAPLLVTVALFDPTLAGQYRVILAALGPLNVLSTSLIAVLGLDAWRLATLAGLERLARRTTQISLALLVFTLTYVSIVEFVVIALAGFDGSKVLGIALVCAAVALLNSGAAAPQAATLALGGQRMALWIRLSAVALLLLVVIFSVQLQEWVRVDPIGAQLIGAAAIAFVGWWLGYRRHFRRARLEKLSE